MKKQNKFLNYTISVSLIIIFMSIFILFILLSRIVLNENSEILVHFENTKILLEDITEVKEINLELKNSSNNQHKEDIIKIDNIPKIFNSDISDISYININANKSFLTFTINGNLEIFENYYYIIENEKKYEKDQYYLADIENEKKIVQIISINEKKILAAIINDTKIIEIKNDEILGKIIFKND